MTANDQTNQEFDDEFVAWEHAHGYHITASDADCARCCAGDLPTQAELMFALVQERFNSAQPRKQAVYRAELGEWLDMEREFRRVTASHSTLA